MKNSKKIIIISLFIVSIVSLLISSFAYYSKVVSGSITTSTGKAVFTLKDGDGQSKNNSAFNLGDIKPGDSGKFDVTFDATGSSVSMYVTFKILREELPTNLKFYSTADHKSELHKYFSFLEKGKTNSETITIYWYWDPYKDDTDDNKYINEKYIYANLEVNAIQIGSYVTMTNGGSSSEYFWNNNYKKNIKTITFSNDLSNMPSSCTEENLCWDVGVYYDQPIYHVYAYLVANGSLYDLYIVSEAPLFAPESCGELFSGFSNLTKIDFNNNFNTSNTTITAFMFDGCSKLTNIDLSNFNTSKVTIMNRMFGSCSSLTSLNLNGFSTANTTKISEMFGDCESLTSLDLSSFNITNIPELPNIFKNCSSLVSLNLDSFNTSKVTRMSAMFSGCSSLVRLDLSGFNTTNVTEMNYMFRDCSSLTSLDLSNFNTSNVTYMNYMFYGCSSLTSLDLSNFNTSNVTSMDSMFYDCSNLNATINIMNPNTTYTGMFTNSATAANAKITVNYIADTSTLVDSMIATKSSNSNVIKGNQL